VDVKCGMNFTIYLTNNNDVYAVGKNNEGDISFNMDDNDVDLYNINVDKCRDSRIDNKSYLNKDCDNNKDLDNKDNKDNLEGNDAKINIENDSGKNDIVFINDSEGTEYNDRINYKKEMDFVIDNTKLRKMEVNKNSNKVNKNIKSSNNKTTSKNTSKINKDVSE